MIRDSVVSVVIPAFNSEDYITECLDATVGQTYSNIEVLIVDNGSVDSTRDICAKYVEKDKRVKLFITENNGVSAARNYGIEKASGKYIVFFDADDRPERSIIENYIEAVTEWKNRSYSFIACGMFFDNSYNKFVENKEIVLETDYGYIEGENYLIKRSYASTLAWLRIFNFVTNKFYDNERIKAFAIRFDEKVKIGEDLKFNLDYLDKCSGYIGMINKPLYHYIKRDNEGLSVTYHENDTEDTKIIYRRFIDWETSQVDATKDNIIVIKSMYLIDWICRLTTAYDTFKNTKRFNSVLKQLNSEIACQEFQTTLKEVYIAKKISFIRYASLRSKNFRIFCFLRDIYQLTKG